ncbi:Hypothetical predicted protein [Pelobates cultripes]|uniref:Uncharacterized protein n=1 Tax=Pelobates cultripes TaxID=61616 RepID=A0AAD1VQC5_PELCU|nr:Hypothetical predicted protein [Pelobates cultripes]
MGKKNKKLKELTGEGYRNISDLLLQRPRPKMVGQPDRSSSTSSDADPLNVPDAIPDPGGLNTHLSAAEFNTPATKGDILELMTNMRKFFNADLAVVREEITEITAQANGHISHSPKTDRHRRTTSSTPHHTADTVSPAGRTGRLPAMQKCPSQGHS